jgi:hypothetical protein
MPRVLQTFQRIFTLLNSPHQLLDLHVEPQNLSIRHGGSFTPFTYFDCLKISLLSLLPYLQAALCLKCQKNNFYRKWHLVIPFLSAT